MRVEALAIPEVKLIVPARHADSRGYFSEVYNRRALAEAGVDAPFLQDNQSYSARAGTVRGLHYQGPPSAQAKLVRVLRGAVFDVAVDARKGSPTYGRWVGAELSAENGAQLFVPAGFLHGFATLAPDTEVLYKVDAHYDRAAEGAVRWDDPDLGIDWPVAARGAHVSERDAAAPRWAEFDSPF